MIGLHPSCSAMDWINVAEETCGCWFVMDGPYRPRHSAWGNSCDSFTVVGLHENWTFKRSGLAGSACDELPSVWAQGRRQSSRVQRSGLITPRLFFYLIDFIEWKMWHHQPLNLWTVNLEPVSLSRSRVVCPKFQPITWHYLRGLYNKKDCDTSLMINLIE